ncbi:arylesterase [Prosthecodimorpha staleyi]|uniref:Arylesterase n=1 Tax=Prosthecodimorpha staleyi TaxID=2840188 RepID=A0A947DA01_9HYPH|nr:arylesterase [Prosthecodimorpha staleyi]MBT9291052.1 arylesterase [Prosthecodimorpha staleyi]
MTATPSRRSVLAALASLATLGQAATGPGWAAAPAARTVRIVALGDSLTAGYGLPPGDAFPVRLEAALKAKGYHVEVINAGVSGDTSDQGLARLDWSTPEDADAAIVEFGANDALRGLPPATTRAALDEIVGRLAARMPVLVTGMRAPRNMGEAYANAYDPLFREVAEKHGALYDPFFLEGVVLDPRLNQPDGIHPNRAGVDLIVGRILPMVEDLIGRALTRRS